MRRPLRLGYVQFPRKKSMKSLEVCFGALGRMAQQAKKTRRRALAFIGVEHARHIAAGRTAATTRVVLYFFLSRSPPCLHLLVDAAPSPISPSYACVLYCLCVASPPLSASCRPFLHNSPPACLAPPSTVACRSIPNPPRSFHSLSRSRHVHYCARSRPSHSIHLCALFLYSRVLYIARRSSHMEGPNPLIFIYYAMSLSAPPAALSLPSQRQFLFPLHPPLPRPPFIVPIEQLVPPLQSDIGHAPYVPRPARPARPAVYLPYLLALSRILSSYPLCTTHSLSTPPKLLPRAVYPAPLHLSLPPSTHPALPSIPSSTSAPSFSLHVVLILPPSHASRMHFLCTSPHAHPLPLSPLRLLDLHPLPIRDIPRTASRSHAIQSTPRSPAPSPLHAHELLAAPRSVISDAEFIANTTLPPPPSAFSSHQSRTTSQLLFDSTSPIPPYVPPASSTSAAELAPHKKYIKTKAGLDVSV
ncbi:hypothetical protein C8J57DRAFT_1724160 [Mycena rebaudengoi]|nr:hypothetical protein C8J57DRAFT_1724160 [Mycena rebaudengoi]